MVKIFYMINEFFMMDKMDKMEATKTAMVNYENLNMIFLFNHARQRGDSSLRHVRARGVRNFVTS